MKSVRKNSARERLRDEILNKISRGAISIGEVVMPERKLAEKFGISYMTARKAIGELVEDGILERRHGIGTFVRKIPDVNKTRIFIYLNSFDSMKNPRETAQDLIIMEVLQGIYDGCEKFNLDAQIHFIDKENIYDGKDTTPRILLTRKWNFTQGRQLESDGVPHVFINPPPGAFAGHSIGCDDRYGTYQATSHLLANGYRKLAYLGNPGSKEIILSRYRGFLEALKEHGLAPYAVINDRVRTIQSSFNVVNAFLQDNEKPDAIVAATDITAMGAIMAAHENNLKVPDNVAVTGFDNIEHSSHCDPPLTTVEKPRKKMGFEAVRFLHEWLANPNDIPLAKVFKPKLIIRSSSGGAGSNTLSKNTKNGGKNEDMLPEKNVVQN